MPFTQKQLQALLKRRHPEYERNLTHWNFLESTYNGGRDWFKSNIFRYVKEGDKEYGDRLDRSYRFNHTREIVDLVQKYLFKSPIDRKIDDAPGHIKKFWKKATKSGLNIDQFMRLTSTASSTFGRIWVFVDSTKAKDVKTIADEKNSGAMVYAYIQTPQNVLDMAFDPIDGMLSWILVRETSRDDANPFTGSGKVVERYRLWMRDVWYLFEQVEDASGTVKVDMVDAGENAIGRVPCFAVDHVIGENKYTAPALINDIAYLDRACANYLSNLDAIIQDQTFSQLAMPAQSVLPGEEEYDKLVEMGSKRIFFFDGEGGAAPQYLSPDPRQAQLIITAINKIINEIYHTVGMAGERTKQDNAVGIDNSSGVAKAYDFERLNSLLTSKAESLENAEDKLIEFVSLWNSTAKPDDDLVKYPQTFDVRSLFDEFTVAEKLTLISAPDETRREQMKQVIDKLFPAISKAIKDKILKDLESWPVDPVQRAADLAQATASAMPTNFPASGKSTTKNPQTQNRQGQVTDSTQKKTA